MKIMLLVCVTWCIISVSYLAYLGGRSLYDSKIAAGDLQKIILSLRPLADAAERIQPVLEIIEEDHGRH